METIVTNDLPESLKKTIFADLVAAQDQGASVSESRFAVARKHNLDLDVVKRVEREGLDNEWAPL